MEACDRIPETLGRIRELGVKTGLAINPETPVSAVLPYMELVDMVLVMTVHPGFGGQEYINIDVQIRCSGFFHSLHLPAKLPKISCQY